VNYGVFNENQYMAIARDEALGILETLRQRQDVTSIGVNGSAVYDDSGLTGIWVASVESGSPADNAGIQEGDIITKLEGLVLATNGTMEDYCDILRSHDPSDVLSLEVLRYETSEVLEGQLNGEPLAVAFSFASQGEASGELVEEGVAYSNYIEVWDDTEMLYMEIPDAWAADIDGSPLLDDNGDFLAANIEASSNLEAFWGIYSTPGVSFSASPSLSVDYTPESLLDELGGGWDCVYDGRYEYDDGLYTGLYDWYYECGDSGSVIIELTAEPADASNIIYIVIQAVTEADLDAADHVLNTFLVFEE